MPSTNTTDLSPATVQALVQIMGAERFATLPDSVWDRIQHTEITAESAERIANRLETEALLAETDHLDDIAFGRRIGVSGAVAADIRDLFAEVAR